MASICLGLNELMSFIRTPACSLLLQVLRWSRVIIVIKAANRISEKLPHSTAINIHAVVLFHNQKQCLNVHTFDLIMIWFTTNVLAIIRRVIGQNITHGPMHCEKRVIQRRRHILHTQPTVYKWYAFYNFNAFKYDNARCNIQIR